MNWGKDLIALTSSCPDVSAEIVTKEAYQLAARIHAAYWNSDRLLHYPWLRGGEWACGDGKDAWERAQQGAAAAWRAAVSGSSSSIHGGGGGGGGGALLLPEVVALMDASLQRVSWERYREEARGRPFTLVHGDFHPGNMLWRPHPTAAAPPPGRLVLIDWEMVGVGSGPQDIAQYAISHMAPAARRAAELRLVRAYHDALTDALAGAGAGAGGPGLSWEECWAEYVAGGVGKWVWLLSYIASPGMGVPAAAVRYFQGQLLAFAADHGVTPDNVPMPRV